MAEFPFEEITNDLPENWNVNDILSPDGESVGLTPQHGHNYLYKKVNEIGKDTNILRQEDKTNKENINQKSKIIDGLGQLLLEAPMTPNDNLLTNSDFKSGIINQKGQTNYTGILYGIDMWLGATASTKIIVNKGYISLLGKMRQFIHTIPFKTGDKYTVCVNVNGTDNVWTFDYKEGVTQHAFSNFTVEVNMNTSNDKILFQIISTSSINIYYVKMEKGSYFTGMQAWDRPVEVMKCRRRFRNLNGSKDETIFIGVTDSNGIVSFPISTYDMAKKPSVSLKNIWAVADDSVYQEVSVASTSNRNTILLLTKIPNKTVRLYYSSNDNYFYIDSYEYGG